MGRGAGPTGGRRRITNPTGASGTEKPSAGMRERLRRGAAGNTPCLAWATYAKSIERNKMGPKLVDHLLYEKEDSGILWIKFNRPERMNALIGNSEENGTVAKVGEYMRAGDDDPGRPSHRADGSGPGLLLGRGHEGRRAGRGQRGAISRKPGCWRRAGQDASVLLPRVHQAAQGHLAHKKADHSHDQRSRRRVGDGHGAALRHPPGVREHPVHRVPATGADNRKRRQLLPAQDGRPGQGLGVRLHRAPGRPASIRLGVAELPGGF